MRRKGFSLPLIILSVIILLSGAIILFLLKSKPINRQDNISTTSESIATPISSPNQLSISESTDPTIISRVRSTEEIVKSIHDREWLFSQPDYLSRKPDNLKTAPDDFLNAKTSNDVLLHNERFEAFVLCGESDACPKIENIEYLTLEGYPSIHYSSTSPNTFKPEEMWTSHNYAILAKNKIYRFWFSWTMEQNASVENDDIIEKVINSFRELQSSQ